MNSQRQYFGAYVKYTTLIPFEFPEQKYKCKIIT